MKASLVLDCSVIVPCFFSDEDSPYANGVLECLRHARATAPALWRLEFANVLLVAERKRRISRSESMNICNATQKLPIDDDFESLTRGLSQVLDLGRDYGLSSYDAAYLEVAMRHALPLATLDAKLREAAKSAGVPFFEP